MTFAIDFDGTCVYHRYPNVGPDVPHAERVIKRIKERHNLILWTMRSDSFLQDAVDWFTEREIGLYGVNRNPSQHWSTSPKAYAQMYIDDAALGCPLIYDGAERPYVDWLKVEEELEKRQLI